MTEEMSFQVLLENCQGFSIHPLKFILPARNGEWKRSGEWFWFSLWWHHEAMLACRSQTSWGDVDCHQWVKVGGCWACGCSICKHQCLELHVSCNREPVQGDTERCGMGSFGFAEDQSCRCILNHLWNVWLCMMEVQLEEDCSSPVWKWQGPGQEVVLHALSERAWSFWCCAMQTGKIEQFLQCGLWMSAGHRKLHQDFWLNLMG